MKCIQCGKTDDEPFFNMSPWGTVHRGECYDKFCDKLQDQIRREVWENQREEMKDSSTRSKRRHRR